MYTPKVSIVVPVYQVEKYLRQCVDSILGQTFADFELLLIDDGSTDGSGLICDHYAQIDERVRVIHKRNEGVSAARNIGLEICRGEYITFVDSDDTVDSDLLENAVNSMLNVQTDLIISGLYMETWKNGIIDRTVRYGITTAQNYTIRELLENMNIAYPQICICGPCCKLYKREIIQKNSIRFVEFLNYGEDTYFNLAYFACCKKVFFSQVCCYHYRRVNEESLFGRFHRDTYEVHKMVYSQMRALMIANNCCEEAMNRFEVLYFSLLVGGVHEYYRFIERTTDIECLRQIMKVAKDPHIAKVKLKYVQGLKNKILLVLFKSKSYRVIAFVFKLKYGLR